MTTTIKTHRVTVFECVQDCPLPVGSVYAQIKAIEAYYRQSSSMDLDRLDKYATVKLLDEILEDRTDRPSPKMPRIVPAKYRAIVDYLTSEEYPRTWILVVLRQLDRWQTAMGLDSIEEEHQPRVQALLDEIRAPNREAD